MSWLAVWGLLLEIFGPELAAALVEAVPRFVAVVRRERMRRAVVNVANGHVLAIGLSGIAVSSDELLLLARRLESARPDEPRGAAERLVRHWRRRWQELPPERIVARVRQLVDHHEAQERAALLATFDELIELVDQGGHPYRDPPRYAALQEIREILCPGCAHRTT